MLRIPDSPRLACRDSLVQALHSPSWRAELGAVVPMVTRSRRGSFE